MMDEDEEEYQRALARAKAILQELEEYPNWKPPKKFRLRSEEDRRIWRRMWSAHLEGGDY